MAALQPLTEHGGLIPGCAPFRMTVDSGPEAAVFTIWRGAEPVTACLVSGLRRRTRRVFLSPVLPSLNCNCA